MKKLKEAIASVKEASSSEKARWRNDVEMEEPKDLSFWNGKLWRCLERGYSPLLHGPNKELSIHIRTQIGGESEYKSVRDELTFYFEQVIKALEKDWHYNKFQDIKDTDDETTGQFKLS